MGDIRILSSFMVPYRILVLWLVCICEGGSQNHPIQMLVDMFGFHCGSVDTKCDALCLTHSKPESVASIGCRVLRDPETCQSV